MKRYHVSTGDSFYDGAIEEFERSDGEYVLAEDALALETENEALRGLLREAMGWLPHAIAEWRSTADERYANDQRFKANETLCDRINAALSSKVPR